MFEQIAAWFLFFVGYGLAFVVLIRWLARTRVASSGAPERFEIGARILASFGVLFLAVAPPAAELASRVFLQWRTYEHGGFLPFILAWVASAVPAIVVSRRTLRAGSINPDA